MIGLEDVMTLDDLDFSIETLGKCRIPSPMTGVPFVNEKDHVLYHSNFRDIQPFLDAGKEPPHFEMAGPREKIYFDPSKLNIVLGMKV
jgi:6-phosphofructokinase 1